MNRPYTGQSRASCFPVNTGALEVKLYRIGDRNLLGSVLGYEFQRNLYNYSLDTIGDDYIEKGLTQPFQGSIWTAVYQQNGPLIEIFQPNNGAVPLAGAEIVFRASTTAALAKSPAACPPMPSATAHTPRSGRSRTESSLSLRTVPTWLRHAESQCNASACFMGR